MMFLCMFRGSEWMLMRALAYAKASDANPFCKSPGIRVIISAWPSLHRFRMFQLSRTKELKSATENQLDWNKIDRVWSWRHITYATESAAISSRQAGCVKSG